MLTTKQINDEKHGEFQAFLDDEYAGKMVYTWAGTDKFIIDHTEVEPNHNGKGVGQELLLATVAFARENNVKVIPLCPFASAQFRKNPDIQDVLS